MASILQTISTVITPDMIGSVGKSLGLSDDMTRQGMTLANALITGGLARASSTEEGAARVAEMVEKADGSVLGNLGSVVTSAIGGSATTAHQLFGNNFDLVTSSVKKATGIDIKPLLAMGAPVVLGVVKNMAGQQQLDAAGIASLLESEVKGLARRDSATAKTLKELFKPIEVQDELRAKFTDEEWQTLYAAPLSAAALIMVSDPSGFGGRNQEIVALTHAVADAVAASGPTELVNMLFRDGVAIPTVEGLVKDYKKSEEQLVYKTLLEPVTAAVAIARAKASKVDAGSYQALILATAQKVAAATKEGGFLGVGGADVSDNEKKAIEAITAAVA